MEQILQNGKQTLATDTLAQLLYLVQQMVMVQSLNMIVQAVTTHLTQKILTHTDKDKLWHTQQ
jgi:hypothetical protein